MAGGGLGNIQARMAEIRTRIQQQTATLRSRIPALGKAGSGEALQTLGGGAIVSRVQGTVKRILPGSGTQISFKDGNPAGPLGIGGEAGLQLLRSGGILSSIQSKGVLGTITGGGMMQTLMGGGYRPLPNIKAPSAQTPPAVGPGGYRKFV